jgi:hypothetical protein
MTCEYDDEDSDSIKCGQFLGQLSNYQVLKKDCSMEVVSAPDVH